MNSELPPSAQMMDMLFGFALSRSISVAAQFGIADQLRDGPRSAEELAAATGLHARSLYRMMRALAGAGVFAEDGDKMKHIVHDWSDDECVTFLSHCRESMNPGGKMLVAEMVLPEPNIPAPSKLLDIEMLLFMTGCERTESEYQALLERAGFRFTRIVPALPYSVIEGVKP